MAMAALPRRERCARPIPGAGGKASESARSARVRRSCECEELGTGGAMAMNCASEQEGLCGGGKEKEEETDTGDAL